MARIFLSHSSADNASAIALRDWMSAQGWDDVFLDLDPERGIVAGERWERALHDAANRCEAVLFLVSRAWLSSRWCLKEFTLALRLNKRMFGALIEDVHVDELPADLVANWQVVRLTQGIDHELFRASLPNGSEQHVSFSRSALKTLRGGLAKAGLDPSFFEWPPAGDPDRSPYPGMRPLEAEDAGIFFGRDAPVVEAIDKLRGFAELGSRVFVILGASGAGKSSFLRAGLLPRLTRDDRHFLVLPTVRPERAALSGRSGFGASLEQALRAIGRPLNRATLVKAAGNNPAEIGGLLAEIAQSAIVVEPRELAATQAPAVVLPVDQGEELFAPDAGAEAESFLSLLSQLMNASDVRLIIVVAMRSDAYEAFQATPLLEGVEQATMSLPPLPRGAYASVIEGPAARLKETERPLRIDPGLTAAVLNDLESGGAKDALPLLAFTMERLYLEHGGDGDLTPSEYREFGGIAGSIRSAVERALAKADADPAVPRDRDARLSLLRRALIPWMAGIDPETNSPRRRVARLSEIPEEARPIVDHLVAERLLSIEQTFDESGSRRGDVTVEPVHEALLRQWGLLEGWLEEEAGALSIANAVKRAVFEWEANARGVPWLSHQAGRLEDALKVAGRPDFAMYFSEADRAYLTAAKNADAALRNKELEEARALAEARKVAAERQGQVATRTRIGAFVAGVLAIAAGAAAYTGWRNAIVANERLDAAVSTSENVVTEIAVEFGKQKSMPIDLVRKVLDRSILLLDRLAEKSREPHVLLGKARALTQAGYTFRALGDLISATRVSVEAHALLDSIDAQGRGGSSPGARADAFRLTGDISQAAGKAKAALSAFRSEVDLRIRILASNPDDANAANELTLARNRFADALAVDGQWAEALALYQEQLDFRRHLLASDPDNNELLREIAVSLLKIADCYRATGSNSDARKALEDAVTIIDRLATAQPSNGEYARDLATMEERLGELDVMSGNYGDAERRVRKALVIRAELSDLNPLRADWAREEAVTADRLARIRMLQDEHAEAKSLFERSLAIRLSLRDADTHSTQKQSDVFLSYVNLGDWALAQGDLQEAALQFTRALAVIEQMSDFSEPSTLERLHRALALAKLAEAADKIGLQALPEIQLAIDSVADTPDLSKRERATVAEIERIMALIRVDAGR